MTHTRENIFGKNSQELLIIVKVKLIAILENFRDNLLMLTKKVSILTSIVTFLK